MFESKKLHFFFFGWREYFSCSRATACHLCDCEPSSWSWLLVRDGGGGTRSWWRGGRRVEARENRTLRFIRLPEYDDALLCL
jgi:hypothetical protein